MKIQENYLYTKDHEWLRLEGHEAYIGISEFATHELGDIVYIEVDTVGETIDQGETFGTIEAVKTVADMFMPVTGEVLEFNEELEAHPELVNQDPYNKGWVVKIRVLEPDEVSSLMNAADYQAQLPH